MQQPAERHLADGGVRCVGERDSKPTDPRVARDKRRKVPCVDPGAEQETKAMPKLVFDGMVHAGVHVTGEYVLVKSDESGSLFGVHMDGEVLKGTANARTGIMGVRRVGTYHMF